MACGGRANFAALAIIIIVGGPRSHLGSKNIVRLVEAFKLSTALAAKNRALHSLDARDGFPLLPVNA